MSFYLVTAQDRIAKALLDLETADIRVMLLNNTSTIANTFSGDFITNIATLGEVVDGAYARQVLGARTVTKVAASSYTKLSTGAGLDFGAIGAGKNVSKLLFYEHLGADSVNRPIFVQDGGGLPKTTDGQPFLVQEPANGWMQLVNGTPV